MFGGGKFGGGGWWGNLPYMFDGGEWRERRGREGYCITIILFGSFSEREEGNRGL